MISGLIILIALANAYAAWQADKSFNAIRRTDVGDRFVFAFVLMAISWGFFSLATQGLIPEPSNVRTAFVYIGLVTKLVGVIVLITGMVKLADGIRGYR